eukprot:1223823-Pyramimonas_sp.AAC.1
MPTWRAMAKLEARGGAARGRAPARGVEPNQPRRWARRRQRARRGRSPLGARGARTEHVLASGIRPRTA